MRVTVHPAGDDACGLYRMVEPARVLADEGADVECTRSLTWRVARDRNDRPIGLTERPDTDVVVYQRPLSRRKFEHVRMLQAAGVAVVVELDDDFGSVPEGNPAWWSAHPEWMTSREWESEGRPGPASRHRVAAADWFRAVGVLAPSSNVWLRKACKAADLVTVTTPALADRYAPHGRVAVLPNLVPARYLEVGGDIGCRNSTADVTVGWAGAHSTHVGDLESTGGGVARAVAESGARFRVVGPGIGVRRALGLTDEVDATGWVELAEWPSALAALDVGVVPLAARRFTEAKSALKMLEYAAVGVPSVVSPTPDNLRLAREGIGMVASDPAHWRQWVRHLASNGEARADLAGQSREVAARHTYEAHGGRWWDAWAQALDNRRATAREKAAA